MSAMKIINLMILSIALSGCVSPVSDMMDNRFLTIKPTTPNKLLVGLWTGTMGPYLVTMQIDKTGSGVYCYSYGSIDSVQKIKLNGGFIYIQDGTRVEVKELKEESISLMPPYFGGGTYDFYADKNLTNASRYCEVELSKK